MLDVLILTLNETPLPSKNRPLKVSFIAPIYSAYIPPKNNLVGSYFILTEIPKPKQINNITISALNSFNSINTTFDFDPTNRASMFSLSNELFSKTKPMDGDELKTLIDVIKGQMSDTPTSLI